MNQNKIGKFILQLRTDRKLSQYQLAEMIPISRQAVSKWERGQTIPDSSTLLRLSEIFDVTINELLNGEKLSQNGLKELETTTLNIVDESNKKSKKIKKIVLISNIIILSLLLVFLSYYFINSYNTIKVYTVSGTNNKVDLYNGIFIITKEKSYLKLGKMKKVNSDIKSAILYYKKDNKNIIILDNIDIDEIISDENGYGEKIKYNDLKYILNSTYLEILEKDGTKNIIKLKFERDFVNNSLIFVNKNNGIVNNQTLPTSTTDTLDNQLIIEKIIQNGKKVNDNTYVYSLTSSNKNITFTYFEKLEAIQIQINEQETLHYYLNRPIYTCGSENKVLDNEECKEKIIEIINKYLIN